MLRSYPYRTFVTGLFNSTAFEILQGTDSLNSSRWCDDIRTKEKETCSQLVTNALDQAIAEVG